MTVTLCDYWRSTAAYRVRIGLRLKGVEADANVIDLRRTAHRDPAYRDLNPQMLVPTLIDGDIELGQSLAILEYLDETRSNPPLLPVDPADRGAVRWMCQVMACDIHPLNNLRVLNALRLKFGADEDAVNGWAMNWVEEGLRALEALVATYSSRMDRCFGRMTTLADVCLVPQLYSARRFGVDLKHFPLLCSVDRSLGKLDGFKAAHPDLQPGSDAKSL